jgi:thioester reductase-like protein
LAETIDCIIHSAALVHWIYPYEQVKAQNVLGTQEIIRLAATTRIKSVHHISTTSVFDSAEHSDLNKTVYEDDPLENPAGLTGGYPQSKWVAEKLVMEARKRGIPANIYRPGK